MEVGKLTHSHSQPGGMDRTPPGTPKKGGKMLAVRVQMLDDTITMFQVQAKALGRLLFDQVCNQLNLLESDYFGLEYQECGGTKYWLDLEKPLCRQVGLSLVDTLVKFCVKFYPPDPSQLEEEFTRYLFCLQIKRDLSQGLLQCNINTAALMASYIVQAECGDYVVEDYPDHRYLSSYKFVPNQDQELERRIMENHKKHAGQTPAEADLNLLETARRCELYGIKMHPAKDHEGCPLNLAVAHMGIVVFQNFSKINTFSWAKIRKISFKRKRFLVKLHPEGYGYYKDTVEFFFEGRNECKNFWKKCVENHGFFRCTMVKKVPRQKTRVLSRGSSFRYSGRTQKQIVDFVRENYVKRQTFQRSQSFRHSSSAHSSVANVGTSISAHPLLPLGDNAVVGTPASLSCGSMTLTSSPVHIADIHAGGSPSPQLTTSVSQGTSVTSSPQHFYPQETPYRRAGHQLTKVKRPHAHSHHAISPLHSPTGAAKAAGNHSANHSNMTIIDSNDILSSHSSLRSPEFMTYNDVYSNCYTSLRNCGNSDNKLINGTKTDAFDESFVLLNAGSISHEPIKSLSKNCDVEVCGDDGDDEGYKRHRSASCRDIYHGENVANRKNERNLKRAAGTSYESGESYDKSRRKCYSALTSKNSSIDHPGDVVNNMRIYSSSYPGTTSSLSTESAEGELIEVLDAKYDSQEDVALSHDDVSHDSYELLERELDYNNEEMRNKRSRIVTENERARSCSWGSDRGISPLDFRSTENVIGSDSATDNNFWSLEREKNSKHRSEIDFRSFSHSQKASRKLGEKTCEEKATTISEFLDYNNKFAKRYKEMDLDEFDNLIFNSRGVEDEEVCRGLGQEMRVHLPIREDKENFKISERKNYQSRRKSLEKLDSEATFKIRTEDRKRAEKRREKREKDDRFHEGFEEKEQKRQVREEEDEGESCRKIMPKSNDYANFQEIHLKKFDRVVSNQFGKYPEFLAQANDFIAQEKVLENYEKVCQVGRIAKELKRNERTSTALLEKPLENIIRKFELNDLNQELETEKFQALKKRSVGNANPKVVKPHVERTKSDPYNLIKNQKRSILIHQKSIDLTPQQSEETASDYDEEGFKKTSRSEHDIPYILHKRHLMNGTARNADLEFKAAFKPSKPYQKEAKTEKTKKTNEESGLIKKFEEVSLKSSKLAEAKKAGVQIINLDVKSNKSVNILEPKIIGKVGKPTTAKKPLVFESKTTKKESKRIERYPPELSVVKSKKEDVAEEKEEPIYAEVCKEKILEDKIPPEPPERTSSIAQKPEVMAGVEKRSPAERNSSLSKLLEVEESKTRAGKCVEIKEATTKGKQELPVVERREESLTLFARTRLGLSEGSAFALTVRESNVGSPVSQRRTKSLDAPYVSVHRLPPADAFSSKDDTVDGNESDVVNAAVARFKEIRRKLHSEKSDKKDLGANTESEVDSVFTDDVGVENTFKKNLENQSAIEVLSEEKVLDAVRGKRLLSKIESVDFIDSEGDMDSSKLAESVPIPSDRLVNLPESIRFPSVRQISGQTSEESADGWEQKEVKVKRRTPRRSVGRDEQDIKESVVWDSKDEAPNDDVWDDVLPVKCEGSVGLPAEYLKRGSCGQSIDDDNLSTPMKESSPEHWVSVDDLPEALEREEKLLRRQEKILREKILNEKLKRELNLDTIDVDERYCENLKQKYEEESLSLKENFKGHSLDTYELREKKLREKGNKNSSLDEDLLGNKRSNDSKMLQPYNYQGIDYIRCRVVKDVTEIDQFGDNDEELEEFFVVLDENLGKEDRSDIWSEGSPLRRTISNDESLISVPEEFKDEKVEPYLKEVEGQSVSPKVVEIQFSKEKNGAGDGKDLPASQSRDVRESKVAANGATLSPYSGSRRGSEENRKSSLTEESGRLSPYDNYFRRSSDDPRKLSCENAGRVSPFDDSRRGSDDPRRLSTSEDSRKCSASESVSEETRRRLSSTEETRRKRASLTKQCSVGAESISDDIISGIQECSSSFEQDERDVFEEPNARPDTLVDSIQKDISFEIEVFEKTKRNDEINVKETEQINTVSYLAPPTGEREMSRETEDSVDYCEMDLKDLTEVVKENDISEGRVCGNKFEKTKLTSFLEKSQSLEGDKIGYNDDKGGSTPEVISGQTRDAVATSLNLISEETTISNRSIEAREVQSFPETAVENVVLEKKRRTVPKAISKPKPIAAPKPVDYIHKKLLNTVPAMDSSVTELSSNALKSSLDSSQESDLDRLSDFSLITHVQNQIVRRNLSDAGRCLRRDDQEGKKTEDGLNLSQRTSSDEREKTESSSFEMKSSPDENVDEGRKKCTKGENLGFVSTFERNKTRSKRSSEQDKRDSGEDGSSSSSAPLYPKRELSSTWKPFLLESSGSSSLEEGWLPPDENAHLADEEETSSTSNNQQDDSYHDDVDYPAGVGYPVLNMPSAEMMVGGYGSVYALSRTLSRISERSTSEQERSDEEDITKPSSHLVSAEEESILSSDHQASLSSDPPSSKESSTVPDLPIDRPVLESFGDVIPPPVPEDDWPSPPSSSSVIDTPMVSHIETFYMEIHPEEACKVVVAEPQNETNSSSDENQTLQEESEMVHLSSDVSVSTTTTTQDGTVVVVAPMRPKSSRAGSISEDASISTSEWSGPVTKARTTPESDWQSPSRSIDPCHGESNRSVCSKHSLEDVQKPKIPPKIKPLKVISPTGKTFGFFETPASKVRSPTSQSKFFEIGDRPVAGHPNLRSPTSLSETHSPKNCRHFFDGPSKTRSPTKAISVCTPYYSNVADSAEKSYFGRYDTGSLERTKIKSSRKYCSYYSVSKTIPNEGDSSNSDGPPVTSPNTIPRASKKSKKRHRVAMDLVIRDGKIVAPPKTKSTVVENSDSDRSSPREFRDREYRG